MSSLKQSKAEVIRDQNDRFRNQIPSVTEIPGRVLFTQGIKELTDTDEEPAKHLAELFETVGKFDAFDVDNDPHGEHDFGAFTLLDQKCFWKIDYYAPDMLHGSEDPSDLANTERVLTIMLASEY